MQRGKSVCADNRKLGGTAVKFVPCVSITHGFFCYGDEENARTGAGALENSKKETGHERKVREDQSRGTASDRGE